ncbi:hypothetical protein ACIQ7N_08675 [Lysinibacillus sp. NPDC095746]|uniref:hypothetical protein n=1 Tax=Lysinibacillus sp. NPDC095746 TaxID=3364134 RepID=UPI0038262503
MERPVKATGEAPKYGKKSELRKEEPKIDRIVKIVDRAVKNMDRTAKIVDSPDRNIKETSKARFYRNISEFDD